MSTLLVLCTCPEGDAERLATALVEERLAACVNRIEGVTSNYRWEGRVVSDHECLLLIKTPAAHFETLRARLVKLHPAELPEIIAVDVSHGHAPYLDWVRTATTDA